MLSCIVVVLYDLFFQQALSALCPTMPKCSDNPTTSANSFMLHNRYPRQREDGFSDFCVENVAKTEDISYIIYHVTIN
jgi:hypothetical protein